MTTISPAGVLPRTSAAATLDSHAPTSRSERERIHDANTPWVTTMFGGMMLAAGGGVTSVIGAYSKGQPNAPLAIKLGIGLAGLGIAVAALGASQITPER